MTQRYVLAIAGATFLGLLAALWMVRETRDATLAMSERVAALEQPSTKPAAQPKPGEVPTPGADGGGEVAGQGASQTSQDLAGQLAQVLERLERLDDQAYDFSTEVLQDNYEFKRLFRQLLARLDRLQNHIAAGAHGTIPGTLPVVGAPLGSADVERLAAEAAEHGVVVEPGRVTVRGFLNMRPDRRMPIEYFMTRYPEAGHETLVHLMGNRTLEQLREKPFEASRGMCSALYKGLLAAGFKQGEGFRPDPDSPDRNNPGWLMPAGEAMRILVRYTVDGVERVQSASEWVIDPESEKTLPEDCFRFSGSFRTEDRDTGMETIDCEGSGLIVSTWPMRSALIEVGLESATRNDYRYNPEGIPQPTDLSQPLYLDVMFERVGQDKAPE